MPRLASFVTIAPEMPKALASSFLFIEFTY
jgi:hypothetical protein